MGITQIARPRKTGRVRTFRYNLAKEQRQRVESCPRCQVGSSTATRSGDRNCTYIPNAAIPHSESASADLKKAQRSFAESLEKDEGDAIIDNASDNIRVYRSGQLPGVGKNAAGKMLGEEDAKMTRAPSGTGITNPLDLAYEYGEYTRNRDKANERGIYLCDLAARIRPHMENRARPSKERADKEP